MLSQEMPATDRGLQSANQNLPSPVGQAYLGSLNDGSRALSAGVANGTSQPNVPACKFV